MSSPFVERFVALEREGRDRLAGSNLPWLQGLRARALESFAELGLPTTRDEDWRFTSLAALADLPFRAAEPHPSDATLEGPPELGAEHRITFVNGALSARHSRLEGLPEGVRIAALGDILRDEPERAEPYLGQLVDPKSGAFWALNSALGGEGLFVELAPGVHLERPIHAVFFQSTERELAIHPRNLIIAGAGSELEVIEHYLGRGDAASLTNPVTEIFAERQADITHTRLQEEALGAFHLGGLALRHESGSRIASHSLSSGARLMRLEIQSLLLGEGAHSTLNGLYLARGEQHVDHHTTIDHACPNASSSELYKGILDDRARGIFHGRIHVRPRAQKTNASQSNRILLLSDQATLNTKPQLEIYADDVRCTHGAAIGRLDADALFYLRSRGIELGMARSLLTAAFADAVIRELSIPELRSALTAFVQAWLPKERA